MRKSDLKLSFGQNEVYLSFKRALARKEVLKQLRIVDEVPPVVSPSRGIF